MAFVIANLTKLQAQYPSNMDISFLNSQSLLHLLSLTEKKEEILDEEIENLIAERQAARKAKDFARADEIRGLLLDKGIELKDTREGVKWKRA